MTGRRRDLEGPATEPSARDRIVADAAAKIAEYGVQITAVGPGPTSVPFAYTAGLTAHGLPELLLVGPIHPVYAQQSLNALAFAAIDGTPLIPGARRDDVLEGYDVVLCGPVPAATVRAAGYPVSLATRLAPDNGAAVQVLQVVYPDKDGRFPWDEGYALADVQPLLAPAPEAGP